MKKFISSLLILTMILTSFTLVFADANTVTLSIDNDSYIKVGSTITATFGTAITQAVAETGIKVVKLVKSEDATSANNETFNATEQNLVDSVSVKGNVVTISFGDNLEYSSHYKLTVAASTGIAADEVVYFSTYNMFHRGISKMLIEENFNTTDVDTLPANGAYGDTKIAKYVPNKYTDNHALTVKQVGNAFGNNNKAIYLSSSRVDDGNPETATGKTDQPIVHLESYQGRVAKAGNKLVISFKYKTPNARLADMRIKVSSYRRDANGAYMTNANNTKIIEEREAAIFWYRPKSDTATASASASFLYGESEANRVITSFPTANIYNWHEFTAEYDTSDPKNMKCVYVAIDGKPVTATQNKTVTRGTSYAGNTADKGSFDEISELKCISIYLNEWTEGNNSQVYIDDVKVYAPIDYTATTATSKLVEEFADGDSVKVKFNFTNPVDQATLTNIVAIPSDGGNNVNAIVESISNDLKTATLIFSRLLSGTQYTISIPDTVKDVFANPVTLNETDSQITFGSAIPRPDDGIYVYSLFKSGKPNPGEEVYASASYYANDTGKPASVTLMIALYEGVQLVGFNTNKVDLEVGAPGGSISTSLTVPTKEKHGNYSLKYFAWDSLTGMKKLYYGKN